MPDEVRGGLPEKQVSWQDCPHLSCFVLFWLILAGMLCCSSGIPSVKQGFSSEKVPVFRSIPEGYPKEGERVMKLSGAVVMLNFE